MPVEVFSDLVRSAEDDRTYRGLRLENGMKVVLVSDPDADMAAAALDVHVGSMCDPAELPGLAHFLEHMLFMGTDKFPDENEYNRFLSENGGSSNAYTTADHTVFYFDVAPKALDGALDRFSRFFIAPLFTKSATDRELKAVNSEYEKNVPSDFWRLAQIERSLSEPNHDYTKFSTGNLNTLMSEPAASGIDVRSALLSFHERHYSANIMSLSVVSNKSLDELQELVVGLFHEVVNKDIEIASWPDHPWQEASKATRTYVVPVKDYRWLRLMFPSEDLAQYYKAKPAYYLAHLMGHEGNGSILSELKARGLANTIDAGYRSGAKGFGFFAVNVSLTEAGAEMEAIDEVTSLIFQYIDMLRAVGPQTRIHEEQRNIQNMCFRFKDKELPSNFVISLATALHKYPMKDVLRGPWLINDWKPDVISRILASLTPENVRIAVVGHKFESSCTQTEKWYGTKYATEPIPQANLDAWRSPSKVCENLKLPAENEFIPTNFELVPPKEDNRKGPVIIKESELSRVWYRQDDEFFRPKSNMIFNLNSPIVYFDPHHVNLTFMFLKCLRDDLNEYTYDAELAGLRYGLSTSKRFVSLAISGYNEKQCVLLKKIMSKIVNFKVNPERFEQLKEIYTRSLKNFRMDQPHAHATFYHNLLLSEKAWSKDEYIANLPLLTISAVEDFSRRFLGFLHIEALMHGNLTASEALEAFSIVEDALATVETRPLAASQTLRHRELRMEDGSESVFVTDTEVHKSSCILNYYQCGRQSTRTNVILDMIAQIISEPCFNVLRTQEQLGYIVWSGVRESSGTHGFRVIVQSDKHPDYLDERVELFLKQQAKAISEMSEKDYEQHKSAVITQRLEKPKSLDSRSRKYGAEIMCGQYNFDREFIETEELKTVPKEEVLQFYTRLIASENDDVPERRKLSIHVISRAENGAGTTDPERNNVARGNARFITNTASFKESLPLYPKMPPFQDLATMHAT